MSYIQLVPPNLTTVGTVGGCLSYARRMFNAPVISKYASQAWLKTQYPHKNQDFPPNVAVVIWFQYFFEGLEQGHVATRLPNGQIYSSPYQLGTTHAVLPSINELIRIYGRNGKDPMSYLGWSEDINTVRVVKETNMAGAYNQPNANLALSKAWRYITGLDPTPTQANKWLPLMVDDANYTDDMLDAAVSTPEGIAYHQKAKSYDAVLVELAATKAALLASQARVKELEAQVTCTVDERAYLDSLYKITKDKA